MSGQAVAVILARGGSVGLSRKNLRRVGGETLVSRAVRSARAAPSIHCVVVSTDDAEIADEASRAGAFVIDRPTGLATSTASSEMALLHALSVLDRRFEIVVMLQATSPFIDPRDLDAAVARVFAAEADVVFAAIATPVFLWRQATAHTADVATPGWKGVNHDAAVRPRRQDLPPQVAETGAFYVMRADGLLAAEHRFFGRIEPQLVDERFAVDIDSEGELELAQALAVVHERFRGPSAVPIPKESLL